MNLVNDNLNKIYFKYLFTALGSTIVTSIYSSVDIIAVGHYSGPDGSAAISCISPLFSILFSIGLLLGIGGSVWLGNRRGAGDVDDSNRYFTISLILAVIISIVITVVYALWRAPLLTLFGADETILPLAMEYTQWLVYAVPCFIIGVFLGCFIRNDGSPALCTVAVLAGGIINAVGDFLFVFGFDMGMSGAGLATALGQTVAFIILLSYFLRKKCALKLRRVVSIPKHIGNICSAGMASFIVDLTIGITMIMFNNQIMSYAGRTELAVYGTVGNIAILFQSLFYAVGQSIQPVVSANYGAGKNDRVLYILKASMITATVMGIGFFTLSELIPTSMLKLYMDVNSGVLAIGPGILRLYAVSFLFMGINVVAAYYLQSVLKSWQSVVTSLMRGFVICAALLYMLPPLFGFDAIWLTMPITELLTMFVSIVFLRKKLDKKIS